MGDTLTPRHAPAAARLRGARPEDRAPLARLFARAFADDAVFDWCLRRVRRTQAIVSFFESVLEEAIARDGVTADEALRACAVWTPSGNAGALPSLWRPAECLWMLRLAGPTRLRRLHDLFPAIVAAQPASPHVALTFLAVDPSAQGSGLGSHILRTRLDALDREARAAYVETVSANNVPFYAGHGFKRTGAFHLPRGGPTIHQLWRAPHSA